MLQILMIARCGVFVIKCVKIVLATIGVVVQKVMS